MVERALFCAFSDGVGGMLMSGSGGDRGDYSPPVPVGSKGAPGSGGGGGGGADDGDPCALVQDAPINSPSPSVVSGLTIGDVLDVFLTGAPPRRVLEVRTAAGATAGSLTHRGHLTLVQCIDAGNAYRATVLSKSGGAVIVRIERV